MNLKRYNWTGVAAALLLLAFSAYAVEYTYDGAGRLVGAEWGNGKFTAYGYDANGNLRNRTTMNPTNADVRINKTPDSTSLTGGNLFDFVLLVGNNGPNPATDVIVTDTLPFGMVLRDLRTSQGSCTVSGQTVTCNLGVLPAGSTGVVTLTVVHGLTGTFFNTATVLGTQIDSVMGNNSDTSTASTIGVLQDSDGDGMPNWWEDLYGLNPFSSSGSNGANNDNDGDGFSNRREFFAGTDPNNANDYLKIERISISSPVALKFKTAPYRQYDIDFNEALTNGSGWIEVQGNVEGDGLQRTVSDPAETNSRMYRLEAETPFHP